MLVVFLYLSFLVTEGAYPATHWVVNSEGKIQAQASSVTNKYSYHSPRKPTISQSYTHSYAQLRTWSCCTLNVTTCTTCTVCANRISCKAGEQSCIPRSYLGGGVLGEGRCVYTCVYVCVCGIAYVCIHVCVHVCVIVSVCGPRSQSGSVASVEAVVR